MAHHYRKPTTQRPGFRRPSGRHRHRVAFWTGSSIATLIGAVLLFLGVASGGVSLASEGGGGDAPLIGAGPADLPRGTDAVFRLNDKPVSNARQTDSSVELGLRFTPTVDGVIAGLRVYRPSGQTAAQPATLWTDNGQRLAGLTLPATSAAGWKFVPLDAPVAVTRDTVYVASYHTADGYVADANFFDTGAHPQGLIRPAMIGTELDPRNGVFRYGSTTAFPTQTYRSTNYWIDVAFVPATSPTTTTRPTTTSPTTTRPTTTSPTTTSPTTTTGPGTLPPNTLPEPGQVGFLGNSSSLQVINSSATAPPGSTWSNNTLRVDAANLTLDSVFVKGGIDYYGTGTLTIRNSIVEANGSSWSIVLGRTSSARVDIRDSTLRWPAGVPAPGPTWGNGAVHGDADQTLIRNDISGTPDGAQQSGGNSTYEQNYIHDLRMFGTYPNNTHNDGLQLYGGPNYRVAYNYIELNGYDGTHQNSAVFFSDDGNGSPSPQIIGNYLSGGGFQLRLEDGTTNAVVTDNIFGPLAGGFGHATIQPGASAAVWEDNVDTFGKIVPKPTG